MDASNMNAESHYDALVAETAREHITEMFRRFFGKLEALARSPWMRIRPRVSLVSGALFVLSTLFLPLAMDSCGHCATGPGLDIVTGGSESLWPGFILGFSLRQLGRGFYVMLLVCAICTLALAVLSLRFPKVLTSFGSQKALLAVTGAASLLLLTDYCSFLVVAAGDSALQAVGDIDDRVVALIIPFLILLVCIRCLAAQSVRGSLPIRLTFILGGSAAFVSLTILSVRTQAGLPKWDLDWWVPWFGSLLLYFLSPVILWYRHGLWPARNSAIKWPPVRRRLVWIYLPAVAGQFLAAHEAIEIGVWGLIPCLLGIHLMTFGYLQIVRETTARQPAAQASLPAPVTC